MLSVTTRSVPLCFFAAFALTACGGATSSKEMNMSVDLSNVDQNATVGAAQACTGMYVADDHCSAMGDMGPITQTTNQSDCHPDVDAGVIDPDYGATMCGQMGHDDDCKYAVSWTSTAIEENTPVTFSVTLSPNVAGNQVTGANPELEVFLVTDAQGDAIPGDTSQSKATEIGGGKYTVGPVQFTQKGQWTVRFHFFETCLDLLPDSPHGHAAFYINVP